MLRNTSSQKWRVFSFDVTTQLPVTGDAANITAKIAKDSGSRIDSTDVNPTETEDGYYEFTLSQGETNAHLLEIYPESSTANVQVIGVPSYFNTTAAPAAAPSSTAYGRAAQAIAEQITGMRFGSAITSVSNPEGTTYRLVYIGGLYEVGDRVRLTGGGVSSAPFTITDMGSTGDDYWLEVESDDAIEPTLMLPIIEFVGETISNFLYVRPLPLFSVISVKTRYSDDLLWTDTDVTTLETTAYEAFRSSGIRVGLRLNTTAIPRVIDSGPWLVKHMTRKKTDGILATYAAGFYPRPPDDLLDALAQIELALLQASSTGVFASESLDYYSYQTLSYDQLAVLPHAAIAILRRYARIYR